MLREHGASTASLGLPKEKIVCDKGFQVELDPLMTASGEEKSDPGKNRFYTAVNMPYPAGIILAAE